jgi:2-polyprenyl-3-methyl-5-hydroxy-6-metoxy-1,4-benzoquinol methylase
MAKNFKESLEQNWTINAPAWTRAVRDNKIESRRLATNSAIIEVIQAISPKQILDVGCGEGWLVHTRETRY